jgi:hypothetical protein
MSLEEGSTADIRIVTSSSVAGSIRDTEVEEHSEKLQGAFLQQGDAG